MIQSLEERLRERDREYCELRTLKDKVDNQERLRMQAMMNRGCEVIKAIQNDNLSNRSAQVVSAMSLAAA